MLGVDEDFAERVANRPPTTSATCAACKTARNIFRSAGRPSARVRRQRLSASASTRSITPPSFHEGQDFAGPYLTPIYATAPGVVSYVGVRTGYGNVVEIDHGNGFKTRYAHLAAYSVHAGQRVALDQRIASMGNTGRSTGTHLHYEVWTNGRPQNPARFLKAGDYVQQN